MKKSNKILLGGFLFVVFLVIGIHLSLYAKYKNGHYTVYQDGGRGNQGSMVTFPNISVITVRDSRAVIEFGEELSVEKGDFIRYEQKGDSIMITTTDKENRSADPRQMRLVLPNNVTLTAFNSNLSVVKAQRNGVISPSVFLHNSNLNLARFGQPVRFGQVKLNVSDHSNVVFDGNSVVGRLEATLTNSSFEYTEGDIGELSIATDSTSQLKLQSKYILKAKIKSILNTP